MKPTDFIQRVEQENSQTPGSHTLFPGLTDAELQAWYADHPGEQLPVDLITLLRWSNGMGIHQDYYDGKPIYHDGAYRFFPLAEITRADLAMYDQADDDDPRLPPTRRAIVRGPDSSVYFGYDSETLHFWQLEPVGVHESEDLGPDIDPILKLLFP